MAKADEPRDPFEGLVLDDDFVRGGRYEAPARTRDALARHPASRDVGPPPSPPPARRRQRRHRRPLALLLVAVLLAGGAVAAVHAVTSGHATSATAQRSAPQPVTTGPAVTPSPSTSEVELSDYDFRVGSCYTWNQVLDRTSAQEVPCGQPHLAEAVQRQVLQGYRPAATYPSDAAWRAVGIARCTSPTTTFLRHSLDPAGLYAISLIKPVPISWEQGSRVIECILVDARPGTIAKFRGPHAPLYTAFSGAIDGTEQAYRIPGGTCENNTTFHGQQSLIDVPCTGLHFAEFVGTFTLPASGEHPDEETFEDLVHSRCEALVTTYAGHPVSQTATRYVAGALISAGSWQDGNRTVNCAVYAPTVGGSPRPVSGSVRSVT